LLRNDGNGAFARIMGLAIEDGGPGQGAAWGDYDNDGDLDLYVANYGTANKLIRNEGGNAFVQITAGPLGDRGNGTGVAWGDADNDGDLDLYLANYGTGNKLLRNDGSGVFSALTTLPLGDDGNGTAVAWADYDLDGDLDLYLVHDGQSNVLMCNDQNGTNHWLELHVVGQMSNRSAIGTRVTLYAGGTLQTREVSGGSGYLSQNELTLHFGLGTHTLADSVVIAWPSGLVERHFALPVNRRINLVELEAVAVEEPSSPTLPLALLFPAPNPVRGEARLGFTLPRAAHVRLRLIALDGREVVTLLDGEEPAGRRTLSWTGHDRENRRVASGVYIVRFEALGAVRTRKLVIVR
jgi:enediyne biosynthesis protein E4